MDIYVVGLAAIALIIMLSMMTHGFRTGFAREVTGLISLVATLFIILLLGGIVDGFRDKSASNLAIGLVLLLLFGVIFRVIHIFMTSVNFIARLPLIRWLDSALGLVTGLLEGFAILYALEYFLRNYLLA